MIPPFQVLESPVAYDNLVVTPLEKEKGEDYPFDLYFSNTCPYLIMIISLLYSYS
jgi:hypothetical protein